MSTPSDASGHASSARLTDGRSAAAIDVGARLGSEGVEIRAPGGAVTLWPYRSLATAEPLTTHAIDALLTSSTAPGATLFVPDAVFARRLLALAPDLGARAERWRHARPWVIGSALIALAAVAVVLLDLSPAHTVARLLPERARTALGAEVIRTLTANRRVCAAGRGAASLGHLTERLETATPGNPRFEVIVVDWGLVNAFAVPGERIVLTRGLVAGAGGPDEVAGVLAHEMGHGIEMHPETALVRAIGLSAAVELMLGGSGGTLANIGVVLAQLSYTRAAERSADAHALAILEAAHVSPQGLADFFTRAAALEDRSSLGKAVADIDLLRTHPVTEERRRMVESRPRYPATPALDAADWQALQTICEQESP